MMQFNYLFSAMLATFQSTRTTKERILFFLLKCLLYILQIVVEGHTGHGSKSDIGIDDLSLTPGHC